MSAANLKCTDMLIKLRLPALALIILTSLFQGCASSSGCREACILGWGPGSPSFDAVALAHDRADPCQAGTTPERRAQLGRPEGYQRPDWCFSGRRYQTPVYITNMQGKTIGKISR